MSLFKIGYTKFYMALQHIIRYPIDNFKKNIKINKHTLISRHSIRKSLEKGGLIKKVSANTFGGSKLFSKQPV